MIKLVILDGAAAGYTADINNEYPPMTFVAEVTEPVTPQEFFTSPDSLDDIRSQKPKVKLTFHLTFFAIDRGVALYTQSGHSANFLENPLISEYWIKHTREPEEEDRPLADERAQMKDASDKRESEQPRSPFTDADLKRWVQEGKERFGVDIDDGGIGAKNA